MRILLVWAMIKDPLLESTMTLWRDPWYLIWTWIVVHFHFVRCFNIYRRMGFIFLLGIFTHYLISTPLTGRGEKWEFPWQENMFWMSTMSDYPKLILVLIASLVVMATCSIWILGDPLNLLSRQEMAKFLWCNKKHKRDTLVWVRWDISKHVLSVAR